MCEHSALFSLLSDGYFDIQSKYLESKIDAKGRPREKARIGCKVWSCGDDASEMDSGVMSPRTDASILFGVVRRTILGTESDSEM